MSDDFGEDRQRKHDERNRDQAAGANPVVRRIGEEVFDRKIMQAFNDLGIDFASFQGRVEFQRVLEYMRERHRDRDRIAEANAYAIKMKAREAEIDEALTFVRELRRKASEVGSESRKGAIQMIFGAIAGAITAAVGTYFGTRH